ncbi:MAG: CpXC domain-containing protein [Clostridia bacterium]|nr:CpXC domain-containing protein [Clostridia bacterium]
MSMQNEITLTCKDCGHSQNFTMWNSINIVLNPELNDKLKNQSLFRFKCEECGEEFTVEYPVLYHDANNKFMIQYLPDTASKEDVEKFEKEKEDAIDVLNQFTNMGYKFRAVRTRGNLISKIYTFENGLNDLPVEFLKNVVYNESPEEMRNNLVDIRFDGIDDENKLMFILIYNDGNSLMCKIPKNTYDDAITNLEFIEPEYYSEVTMNNVFGYIKKEAEKEGE